MKSRFIIFIPTDTREATAVSFIKVAGVPLFLRGVLALSASGEKAFTIVAPFSHRRQVLKLWQKTTKDRGIHLNLVLTKENNRISSDEIAQIKQDAESSVCFLNANYILPSMCGKTIPSLESTIRTAHNEVVLLKPSSKKMSLLGFNGELLDTIVSSAKDRPITMEKLFDTVIEGKNKRYITEGEEGLIVQKFYEVEMAEHLLAENIRKNTQTFVAREINKRISLPISLLLAKMRVTPNTITVINMFIGLCAGIGAAGRTYTGVLIGAILFQLASIIDGCDGEVAKLTYRTSKFGQYIDSISDNLSLAAFLTGMMIHQYRISDSYMAFVFGGSLILGALSLLAIMSDFLKRKTNSASFVTFDKEFLQKLTPNEAPKFLIDLIRYFKILFKKDFFSLTFLVFAIFGILHWWFYFISVGIWVGVLILLYLRRLWIK